MIDQHLDSYAESGHFLLGAQSKNSDLGLFDHRLMAELLMILFINLYPIQKVIIFIL